MRGWLQHPRMGSFPLLGLDRATWEPINEQDLVQLHPRKSTDIFSRWVIETLVPLFHQLIGKHFKVWSDIVSNTEELTCLQIFNADATTSEFASYSDRVLGRLIDVVGTMIASLFPILSIVLLYLVTKTSVRLGIIAAFTAAFSLCLSLVTQARKVEIFAATAA